MKPAITLSQALADPDLFGAVFSVPSFWTWKVVAKLIDGVPLTEQREIELFEQCTGRRYNRHTLQSFRRLFILAGRRAGKDRFESAVGIWRAALCANWHEHISAGEGAVCLLLGADRRQASILRKYCDGLLRVPLLAKEVMRQTDDVIEFKNGGSLEIGTNNASLIRGRSAVAVLGSECCHWRTDEGSSSSDEEVVGAAEPSMAMVPDGGLLLLGSSVYRRRGFMYRMYRKLHGNDAAEDNLCWFAPSRVMNPKLPQSIIDKAIANDAAKARAEYENIWREDVSDFVPLDIVESCTDWGVIERPPERGIRYVAYHDAAGGTGKDSFTLAICHAESSMGGRVFVDLVRERKPRFVAEDVTREFSDSLSTYRVSTIMGDGYAGGLTADAWARNGKRFVKCPRNTGDNYLAALPLLTSGRARLIDAAVLRSQLTSLERKVVSGHETVTHPSTASAHDDVAAAVCGGLVAAAGKQSSSAWMQPENLRRVRQGNEMRPKYERPLGDERSAAAMRVLGERRFLQVQRMNEMRRWR
jgi:hypothetical protein